MEKKRKGAIDLLRIVAATLIILHHYQQGTGIQFKYVSFYGGKFNFGYIVELFFIISGLLTYKYISKITINTRLWEFFEGKVKRIVPLLVISVFVEAILRYVHEVVINGTEFSRNLVDIVINMLGGQSLGIISNNAVNQPTWYLSVLLMCYICFFISTSLSKRLNINNKYLYICMVILGVIINTYSLEFVFLNRALSRGYFSFFLGVLLAEYIEKPNKSKWEYIVAVLPVLFLWLLKYKPDFLASGDFYFYSIMLWIPIIIVLESNVANTVFQSKWINVLGKASFSVYLWNEPLSVVRGILAVMIPTIDLCKLSSAVIFTICNWIVGLLSFYLIEKNIEKLIGNK